MQQYRTAARLLSGLMISATLMTPAMALTGTVNTGNSNLHLRAEANTSSRILDKLRNKTQVEVLSTVADGAWYQVSHSGTIGYVSADYLLVDQDEAANLGSMYVKVTASALNIRTGAGTNYAKTGKLHSGDVVKVLSVKNGWYQLENGYICADYTVKTSAPAAPAEIPEYVQITTASLNVRTGPSTNYSKAGKLHSGDVVKVVGMKDGWYQLENGYISSEYAVKSSAPSTPAKPSTPTSIPEYVKVTASSLNVRTGPGTNYATAGKLYSGDVVKVVGMENGWYQLENGYISADYAVKSSKPSTPAKPSTPTSVPEYVKITASSLNVRTGPGTSYGTAGKLYKGDVVKVVGMTNGWYQLENGYISSDYAVKSSKPSTPAKPTPSEPPHSDPTPSTPSSSSKGQEIANYAKQFKGYPYVYGGSTPSGFDCSGFTKYVYAHFGYNLSRTAAAQLSNGTAVSKSQLQPGDLVLFRKAGSSKRATHVGLYIGGGQFIHASTPKTGVIISNLNSSYYTSTFVGARRIV